MRRARRRHGVVFLVFEGFQALDLAGPADVFAEANKYGGGYDVHYWSPAGWPVRSSAGMAVDMGASASVPEPDTLIVCGGDVLVSEPVPRDLLDAIGDLGAEADRVVSICTGSFALAAAGLLAGRRATTHWRHAALLAKAYPDVDVRPDELFVEDEGVFTSAGVSAGIDLVLALVEKDHGAQLAREVARNLVMFMQRPGGQSQYSTHLEVSPPRTPTLRAALDVVAAQPALDHSAARLADRVGVSARQLSRLFAAELNTTPARYVEGVRVDHARALLDAGHSVAAAARESGLGSAETLRRVFVARLGITPSQYRDRFGSTERHR